MSLPLISRNPDLVLKRGMSWGFHWVIIHNRMGFRNGYIQVKADHPWHGRRWDELELDAEVHGGLTYSTAGKPVIPWGLSSWWLGFDCCHAGDRPDPTLPGYLKAADQNYGSLKTTEFVQKECESLCRQAFEASNA